MAAADNPCKVEECNNLVGRKGARGLCNKHYLMWWKTGDPLGSTAPTEAERFWAKVDKSGNCWLWTAAQNEHGYGLFSKHERTSSAHRWAYENTVGPIPVDLVLDHLCRVRNCVNPDHLEPVTNDENLFRGIGRRIKNGTSATCINGHDYTPENTYQNPKGMLVCRTCMAVSRARYEQRNAA